MVESKLINEKKSEDGTRHDATVKYEIGQLLQIFTDGIEEIPIGEVKSIVAKNSKFVGSYFLYGVEYTHLGKLHNDLFYANELYPLNEVITKKKRKKKYLNNRDLFKALIKWKAEREINPEVRLPEYIGECFIKLVNNIARQGFHSHIDDMKGEALMLCCRYAHNFDPDKSINAFAYFSRYVKNAFALIHNNEKSQINGKFQFIKNQYCNDPSFDYRDYDNDQGESDES